MTVVVILPTYNEKGNIERLISILEEEIFPKIKNREMHILVADDNSPDGTGKIVKDLIKKYRNLHLIEGEKQGLGAAYVRAMNYAVDKMGADIMFEMDADFFHDPKKVPEFLEKISKGYDFVVGTRYSQGGSIPKNWGLHRKAFSIFGNLLVKLILMRFSIHDWTGGYRAIKKEVFLKEKDSLSKYKGYTFQVAFLYGALKDGFRIAEIPFHATDRVLGRSKIASFEYIVNLLKYVLIARVIELKRFVKFLIVGGTGFLIQIITQEVSIFFGVSTIFAAGLFFLKNSGQSASSSEIIAASHSIGTAIGAEFAILANFTMNNFWTFGDTLKKQESGFLKRLAKFNTTSLLAIFLQAGTVLLGEKMIGASIKIFAYVIPTRLIVLVPTIVLIIIPLNFLIYNKIIWKTKQTRNEKTS